MQETGTGNACKPERQKKHVAIDESIGRIENVQSVVQNLLNRITGQNSPPNECDASTEKNLEQVLNETPARLNSLASDINELILQIEDKLF